MKTYLSGCLLAFSVVLAGPAAADELAAGVAAYDGGRYRAAYKLLKPVAERGDAVAQNYLGKMYAAGRLPSMDGVEAAAWFERSAAQGNADAQYNLAKMYLTGWGVPKEPKNALGWLWKSGRQGNLKAQLLLGKLLSEGAVVERDTTAARLWLAQAASQGSAEAARKLEALGGADGLAEDLEAKAALAAPSMRGASGGTMTAEQRVQIRMSELRQVRSDEGGRDAQPAAAPLVVSETPLVPPGGDLDAVGADLDDGAAASPDEIVLEEFSEPVAGDDTMTLVAGDESGDLVLEEVGAAEVDELSIEVDETGVVDAPVATQVAVTEPPPPAAGEPGVAPQSSATDRGPPEAAAAAPAPPPIHGRDWLLSRPPKHYTIQLLGSHTKADAEAFAAEHPLPGPVAIVESTRRGKPWYSVFYGDFGKYSKALAAHGKLAGPVAKHGPWVRPFGKIQQGLKR